MMPRCLLCNEWAGPDKDLHDECLSEFEHQMHQPTLLRRLLTRTLRAARSLYAAISPARTN
jgi:hypothetical protein